MRVNRNNKEDVTKRFGYLEDPSQRMSLAATTSTDGYSARIVAYAEQLKYEHEHDNTSGVPHHSDEEYLQIAARYYHIGLSANYAAGLKHLAQGSNPVPDPEWVGYSYEEIIAMSNNGVNVPKEVLSWAEAQKDADIISYVVISDEAALDDGSSTEEVTGDSQINNLRNIAKQNIVKAVSQQETLEVKTEEVQNLTNEAASIKKESLSLQGKMKEDKTQKKINRLKELKEKSEEKELNPFEKFELKKLQHELGQEGEIRKEIQQINNQLDSFLDSIDTLAKDCVEGAKVADETVKSGEELSKLDSRIGLENKTHDINKMKYVKSDDLASVLKNLAPEIIPELAVEKGKDLGNQTLDISEDMSNETMSDLMKFSDEYIKQNKNKEKSIDGDIQDIKEDEEQKEKEELIYTSTLQHGTQQPENSQAQQAAVHQAKLSEVSNESNIIRESIKTPLEMTNSLLKTGDNIVSDMKLTNDSIAKDNPKESNITSQAIASGATETVEGGLHMAIAVPLKATTVADDAFNVTKVANKEVQPIVSDTAMLFGGFDEDKRASQQPASEKDNNNNTFAARFQNALQEQEGADNAEGTNDTETNGTENNKEPQNSDANKIEKIINSKQLTTSKPQAQTNVESETLTAETQPATFAPQPRLSQDKAASQTESNVVNAKNSLRSLQSDAPSLNQQIANQNSISEKANQIKIGTNYTSLGMLEMFTGIAAGVTAEAGLVANSFASTFPMGADATVQLLNNNTDDLDTIAKRNTIDDEPVETVEQRPSNKEITEQKEETPSTEENKESKEQNQEQQNNRINLDVGFGAIKSTEATEKTVAATAEMLLNQPNVEIQIKEGEKQAKETLALSQKVEKAKSQKELEPVAEPINIEPQEVEKPAEDKNIIQAKDQVNKTKNQSKNLKASAASYNSISANQLDISEKSMLIGAGTVALGTGNTMLGNTLIASGLAMMSNPFTYAAGLTQFTKGTNFASLGMMKISTGMAAGVTTETGLFSNAIASTVPMGAESTALLLNQNSQNLDKNLQSNEQDNNAEFENNDIQENNIEPENNDVLKEDDTNKVENNTEQNGETTEDKENNKNEEESKSMSLQVGFGAMKSMEAMTKTLASTAEMVINQGKVEALDKTADTQSKLTKTLTKDVEKQNEKIQSALNSTSQPISDDTQADATKSLTKANAQAGQIQNASTNLRNEGASLKSLMSNQFDISTKSLAIGVGTIGLGGLNTALGTTLITSGTLMTSSLIPAVQLAGLKQIAVGTNLFGIGSLELATGEAASIAALAGIGANTVASAVSTTSSTAEKILSGESKNLRKALVAAGVANKPKGSDAQDDEGETSVNNDNEVKADNTQNEIVEIHDPSKPANNATVAATLTTFANHDANSDNDNKADRRLTRFNQDSSIESRKKRKKVTAIAAATGSNVKG